MEGVWWNPNKLNRSWKRQLIWTIQRFDTLGLKHCIWPEKEASFGVDCLELEKLWPWELGILLYCYLRGLTASSLKITAPMFDRQSTAALHEGADTELPSCITVMRGPSSNFSQNCKICRNKTKHDYTKTTNMIRPNSFWKCDKREKHAR